MKLVIIEWIDSHSGSGWSNLDDIKENSAPCHCRSVGWLLVRSKEMTTIIAHVSGEQDEGIVKCGRGEMHIPTQCITKIKRIKP